MPHFEELRAKNDRASSAAEPPALVGGSTVYKGAGVVTVPAHSFVASASFATTGVTAGMVALASISEHVADDENTEEMLSVDSICATAGSGSVTVAIAFGEPTGGPVRVKWMAV